jgi:hypothetical protein
VLQEVEKEVVLLDQNGDKPSKPLEPFAIDMDLSEMTQNGTISTDMSLDIIAPPSVVDYTPTTSTNGHHVLKVIRKVEVQVLCTQHNPVR